MKIALRFSEVHFQETSLSRSHVSEIQYPLHIAFFLKAGISFSWRLNLLVMCLKFPLCFEWVKGIGLDYKNANPLSAIEQVRDLSIQDRGLLCIKSHTPPLFPIASNCFSFENRSVLKSVPAIRIQVGLLGAEWNILNPYELGKHPLACCESGSRLENQTTACVVLLKWVCVIDSNNIISSYRGYFV